MGCARSPVCHCWLVIKGRQPKAAPPCYLCRSTTGYQIRRALRLLQKKMEVLSHGESKDTGHGVNSINPNLLSYET